MGRCVRPVLQGLWYGVVNFVPNLVVAVIIFILGWMIGSILGRLVAQVIKAIRVDTALESAGAADVLSRAGFKLDSGAFIGGLVKWFFIVVFLVASFDVLGLSQVNIFLQDVVLAYLPNVIVAALILLVAAVLLTRCRRLLSGPRRRLKWRTRTLFWGRYEMGDLDLFAHHSSFSTGGCTGIHASALHRCRCNACSCGRPFIRSRWQRGGRTIP